LARDQAAAATQNVCHLLASVEVAPRSFVNHNIPLSLQDLQRTNSILLASGLSITDMNVIRKRLETGKGGELAAAVYPSSL
jgi:hypothetical protein